MYWVIACIYCLSILYDTDNGAFFISPLKFKEIPLFTIISAYVTLFVNYKYQISSQTMQQNSMRINGKSDVDFLDKQEFISSNDKTLFKIRIYGKKDILLKNVSIERIDISLCDSMFGVYKNCRTICKKQEAKLEYTPVGSNKFNEDSCFYYVPVTLDIEKQKLLEKYFKIRIEMTICSMYDVETKYILNLIFNPEYIKEMTPDWFKIEHRYINYESIEYVG